MEFWPKIQFDFPGILFLVFCTMVLTQLIYAVIVPLRVVLHKKGTRIDKKPGVSIIVCARNEEDNLFKNLPAVLTQDYPKYEVIVVNDMSVDESKHILQAYQKQYPHLRIIELEKNRHRKFSKKMPLTIGIKGAENNILVMIDADCYPAGNQWLKTLVSNYSEGKEIVIGYGPYEKLPGFLNRLIRYDTAQIAATYFGFAKNRRPYMAVGRNMSYTRTRFFEVDGFKRHYHIQSGDDDLFMSDAATRKNVALEMSPESFVYSHPKQSFAEWIKQKQRHYTTAPKYRLINKLLLGIFPGSLILMLLSFLILLFNYKWWLFVVTLLVFRYLVYWLITSALFKKLAVRDLIIWFPVIELIHAIVMPFIYYSSDKRGPDKW